LFRCNLYGTFRTSSLAGGGVIQVFSSSTEKWFNLKTKA
jgi:hypothetical protein